MPAESVEQRRCPRLSGDSRINLVFVWKTFTVLPRSIMDTTYNRCAFDAAGSKFDGRDHPLEAASHLSSQFPGHNHQFVLNCHVTEFAFDLLPVPGAFPQDD